MRKTDEDPIYLTFSEIQEEFPKASKNWNWTAKMFYYLSLSGLIKRRMNQSIKAPEYSRASIVKVLRLINSNLDDLKIDI